MSAFIDYIKEQINHNACNCCKEPDYAGDRTEFAVPCQLVFKAEPDVVAAQNSTDSRQYNMENQKDRVENFYIFRPSKCCVSNKNSSGRIDDKKG